MMLRNHKMLVEETNWEKMENKVKTSVFFFMHKLMLAQLYGQTIFKFLLTIETLQFLFFSINPDVDYLFKTATFEYLQIIVQYFQYYPFLKIGNPSLFLLFLYSAFSLQMIMLTLLVLAIFNLSAKGKLQLIVSYSIKTLSIYSVSIQTILTIPFLTVFYSAIYCNESSQLSGGFNCYESIYYLHFTIGVNGAPRNTLTKIVGLILFICLLIFFTLFQVDVNPASSSPQAAPLSKIGAWKLLLKFVLPLYVVIDYEQRIYKSFAIILTIVYFLLLILRYQTPPYFHKNVNSFVIICESGLLWVSLVTVFHAYLDFDQIDDLGFLYLIIGMPFKTYFYHFLLNQKQRALLQKSSRQMRNEEHIEQYIYSLMELIETRYHVSNRILLEGILKMHRKECMKSGENCSCQVLFDDPLRDDDTTPAKTMRWYLLIRSLLWDGVERFPKSARLHLLNAFIHQDKLKNKFKALHELMRTEESRPTFQQDFLIYRFKHQIEQEMIVNDQLNIEEKENCGVGVNVNSIVKFQNKFVKFQQALQNSVDFHLEFWRELQEENPDIQKLHTLGTKITMTLQLTQELFRNIQRINNYHIKCLRMFGNFLKDIVNDEIESQRILDKADYIERTMQVSNQLQDNDKSKYGDNSNICIIAASGNYSTLGVVTSCNNEITRILGFSKMDLIGQKVNRLMPKFYSDLHDSFMNKFLETSESKVIGQERLVLAQNKSGYLVSCTLMIKVLPNLRDGIQIVGFLKEIDEQKNGEEEADTDLHFHYIIYNANTNVVLGVTKNCFDLFGIPASLVYGNSNNTVEFTMDGIAPDLVRPENYDVLKSQGLSCFIDTTTIQQNYLLAQNESESDERQEKLVGPTILQESNLLGHSAMVKEEHNLLDVSQNNYSMMIGPNQLEIQVQQQQVVTYLQQQSKLTTTKKFDRYRRAEIRAQLIEDQEYYDSRVHVIKFIEIKGQSREGSEEENLKKNPESKHYQNDQEQQAQQKISKQVELSAAEQKPILASVDVSQEKESQDSNVGLGEELRLIKDFKNLMNEKSQARNIKFLKRIVILLGLCLVLLSSVELAFKVIQNSDVLSGEEIIYNAYMRNNLLGDVIFSSRILDLLGRGIYQPRNSSYNETETAFKEKLSEYVNRLQQNQFDVIKGRIKMDQKKDPPPEMSYNITFLLQNAEFKIYENVFNDAFFQLLTSAAALRNASLASFNSNDTIESTQKNFFYIIKNGYGVLRLGAKERADSYYHFYDALIQDYKTIFIVTLTLTILILISSQIVIIPIVFRIHTINNQVLSLFGLIEVNELRNLSEKCENFKNNFLEDFKRQERTEVIAINQKSAKPEESKINEQINNEQNVSSEEEPKKIEVKKQDLPQGTIQGMTKVLKELASNKEELKDDDQANAKSQKLLNSRTNSKTQVICQFFFVTAIFISFYAVNFNLEVLYLQNIKNIYQKKHLQLISLRPTMVKFSIYFTFEEIVQNQVLKENGQDLRETFILNTYNVERDVFISLQKSYPGNFDEYQQLFDKYNYENLCEQKMSFFDFTLDQEQCSQVLNGLLLKGLKTTITSAIMKSNDIIDFYNAETNKQNISQIINSVYFDQLNELITFINPALNYLSEQFTEILKDYLIQEEQIETIKFSCLVIFILFVFLILWIPYHSNLSLQIWRTKGMLNMIPLDVIQKYDTLKHALLYGDIIKGVK